VVHDLRKRKDQSDENIKCLTTDLDSIQGQVSTEFERGMEADSSEKGESEVESAR
jgi:hypothetical protein